jgi:cell envelope opacity-associated protein A
MPHRSSGTLPGDMKTQVEEERPARERRPYEPRSRAAVWWRRLFVMTRKEMIQLFRDLPIVLFFVYSFT